METMKYQVYAIYNEQAKKTYIGQTENLNRRLAEHNGQIKNPSEYTSRYKGNWLLIYSEELNSRSEALAREKQLKSYQGRLFVKRFIPG